ncbi:hypothetical protein LMG24076_05455 [Trinickia soli]|nr:hypothetical protein LMG24076_05455 [Trinickia soli]
MSDVSGPILHHPVRPAHAHRAGHLQANVAQIQAANVDVACHPDVEHRAQSHALNRGQRHRLELVSARAQLPVAANLRRLVPAYRLATVVTNGMRFVVLDLDALILLGMNPDFFLPALVFEADRVRVGRRAPFTRTREHATLRGVGRQCPRWRVHRVVDARDNQRAVWISVHKQHDRLFPDPRNLDHAEAFARPRLPHTQPRRAALILLAEPVPVKLHLHAAQRVRVDFLAFRANHGHGLRSRNHRTLDRERRPIGNLFADAGEAAAICRCSLPCLIVVLPRMRDRDQHELPVLRLHIRVVVMALELEVAPWH